MRACGVVLAWIRRSSSAITSAGIRPRMPPPSTQRMRNLSVGWIRFEAMLGVVCTERPMESEAEVAHPGLVPAEVVGELVLHHPLDLRPQQRRIVPEVALQGVLVDDDPV